MVKMHSHWLVVCKGKIQVTNHYLLPYRVGNSIKLRAWRNRGCASIMCIVLHCLYVQPSSNKETYSQKLCYSLTYTLTPQLLWLLYIANEDLCWKWFPDSTYLMYPCSYSALFNLHTLRTVCERRWQPTLSHENQSCTRDKGRLIWLQDTLLRKTQVYHIPTVSPCCLVFQF